MSSILKFRQFERMRRLARALVHPLLTALNDDPGTESGQELQNLSERFLA